MKYPKAKFYPAHTSNYTQGRRGRSIEWFTVHHMGALNSTLRYLWGNASRNGSSHFGVFNGYTEQYVDTDNGAWTNGVFDSNMKSITCETRGDWRFGYYDQSTLDQLTELMYWARKNFKGIKLNYHNDVATNGTLCPADLKAKGYAKKCWDIAGNRIALENKPIDNGLRVDIPDKKVILTKDTNLWDMDFAVWGDAKPVMSKGKPVVLPEGTVIDVAGVYDHKLSTTDYYLSKYSWDRGLNHGISKADVKNFTEKPVVIPPTVPPVDVPGTPESEEAPEGGAGTVTTDSEKIAKILETVNKIWELISGIFKKG